MSLKSFLPFTLCDQCLYPFIVSPIRAACPAHLMLSNLIILITFRPVLTQVHAGAGLPHLQRPFDNPGACRFRQWNTLLDGELASGSYFIRRLSPRSACLIRLPDTKPDSQWRFCSMDSVIPKSEAFNITKWCDYESTNSVHLVITRVSWDPSCKITVL